MSEREERRAIRTWAERRIATIESRSDLSGDNWDGYVEAMEDLRLLTIKRDQDEAAP